MKKMHAYFFFIKKEFVEVFVKKRQKPQNKKWQTAC